MTVIQWPSGTFMRQCIPEDRQNVQNAIQEATYFTKDTGAQTYLGAWMPQDNKNGDLSEEEVVFLS